MMIKPCPYCNNTEIEIQYGSFTCAVHCLRCNRYGPARTSEEESISEWNNLSVGLYDHTTQMTLG